MPVAPLILKHGEPVLATAKNAETSAGNRAGRKNKNTNEKTGGTHLHPDKVALARALLEG